MVRKNEEKLTGLKKFNRSMGIANSVHQEKLLLTSPVHFQRGVNQMLLNQHHNHLLYLSTTNDLPKFTPKFLSGNPSAHQESLSSLYLEC